MVSTYTGIIYNSEYPVVGAAHECHYRDSEPAFLSLAFSHMGAPRPPSQHNHGGTHRPRRAQLLDTAGPDRRRTEPHSSVRLARHRWRPHTSPRAHRVGTPTFPKPPPEASA